MRSRRSPSKAAPAALPNGNGRPNEAPLDGAYSISVADKVARLNVLLKRILGSFAKDQLGLNVVETRVVILLGIFAPTTVNELADRSDIDRTQISRALGVLSGRGLVSRAAGGEDRRETLVSLTKAGTRVHGRIIAFLYRHNSQLIAGMSATALRSFFAVMEVLIVRAQGLQGSIPAADASD